MKCPNCGFSRPHGRPKKIDQAKALELRKNGATFAAIGKVLGVSPRAAQLACRREADAVEKGHSPEWQALCDLARLEKWKGFQERFSYEVSAYTLAEWLADCFRCADRVGDVRSLLLRWETGDRRGVRKSLSHLLKGQKK